MRSGRLRGLAVNAAALAVLAFAAPQASAQQNLFNVPNGKITNLGEMFFQQQFNFSRPIGSSNSTFDFGLGHNFELGFNMLDVNFYESSNRIETGRRQENPDVLFNGQKGFDLIEDVWSLGIGSQMGFNPAPQRRDIRYQAFVWAINEFQLPDERGSVYAGAYYANVAYGGPGDAAGGLFGIEIPVIKDRFHFQADYITGNRDISVAVIGGVILFPNHWQLSVGTQVRTFRSHNPTGLVVELTHPGIPLFKRRHPVSPINEPLP